MAAQDKVQVVLLGTTGSGKSASGNTILGKKVFKSCASTQSVTVSYQSATERINETVVTVVDTPGWHCTKKHENEVIGEIKMAISSLHGPYSFLMVIPIGSYTPKEMEMILKLRTILGDEFVNHTTILFSKSDDLESKSFDQFLKEEEGLLKILIQSCGNRVYTWNNKDTSSVRNMDRLLRDLKKTQKINEQSKNKVEDQNSTTKPEQDLIRFDGMAESSDANMKRCKTENVKPLDKPTEPIRVVLLGMSGVGKTSTIKTLIGKKNQTDSSTPPVYMTNRSGNIVKLIDSPGFKNVEEVKKITYQSLKYAEPGPHVIMIVIPVGRVTEETLQMTERMHACLDNLVAHTMILFTRKDDLEDKAIERFIKESSQLKTLVEMHGNRFHALNNKDINDQAQVCQLLEKISAIYHENNGHFIQVHEEKAQSQRKSSKPEQSRTIFKRMSSSVFPKH